MTRAPASRGQRDAGAINPIHPGAVGWIGGLLRQGWSTGGRRKPVGGTGRRQRRPPRMSRDQSGDVEGCAAGDRGRSLALSFSRRCIATRRAVAQLAFTATSGVCLVPAPPPVLPIMRGEVVLAGGLAGTGATGSSPSADCPVKGPTAGAAAAQAATAGRAWFTVISAVRDAGLGTDAVAAAAPTVGLAGWMVAGRSTGACDRTPAPYFAGPDRGRDTGARTPLAEPTIRAWSRGFRTPARTGGWMGSRRTDTVDSALVTAEVTVGGILSWPPDSPSDWVVLSSWTRPVSDCSRPSSAWPVPAPSSHPMTMSPPSRTTRDRTCVIPRGAYRAPPVSGMAATGSPSTLRPSRPCRTFAPTLHAVTAWRNICSGPQRAFSPS
jgi:hypothetical protein